MDDSRQEVLGVLRALHEEVDEAAAARAARHPGRLRCGRGCSGCCVDELSVFEVEARRIRAEFGELLRSERPHPPGACAFLDDTGACRIYAARPYVCRTQGLPLRWVDHEAGVERRDICPLNEPGPPLEELDAGDCWELGPFEARLAALQGDGRRVRLRALFARGGSAD